jgi:hypothetical protein
MKEFGQVRDTNQEPIAIRPNIVIVVNFAIVFDLRMTPHLVNESWLGMI